jgi:hypothetical protein
MQAHCRNLRTLLVAINCQLASMSIGPKQNNELDWNDYRNPDGINQQSD